MTYAGKVAVITRAGSGLGRALALQLGRRGAILALHDQSPTALADTVSVMSDSVDLIVETFDVSDRTAVRAFATRVDTELGGADLVINNMCARGMNAPVWEVDPASYERLFRKNVMSVVHGTQAYLPQMLAVGRGVIVNVASIHGLVGTANHSDYSAAKFAVRGFGESVAAELEGTGVSVHTVFPSLTGTELPSVATAVLEGVECHRERIITGRWASEAEFASSFVQRSRERDVEVDAMSETLDFADAPRRDFVAARREPVRLRAG